MRLFVFVVDSMTWRSHRGNPTGVAEAPLNSLGEKKVCDNNLDPLLGQSNCGD
jgi:hypothetical protein